MGQKHRFLFAAILLLCLEAILCWHKFNHGMGIKINPAYKNRMVECENESGGQQEPIPESEKTINSGPVKILPWENDENFINARTKNGTNVLMGAYRTVLRDPLPGEEYNVHLAAERLAGMVVKPGEIFSQNASLGPYTEGRGYRKGPTYMGTRLTTTVGGGVCKIASTLYNTVVLSDLQVIERHAHSMPVPYVPYGQDATVAYGAKDFKFKNNTDAPILIWAQGIDNILYIAFYGIKSPPTVEWNHKILQVFEAPRIYRINPDLPPSEEKVKVEGMDGAVVMSWVTVTDSNGMVFTKRMGDSYYSPMPYLIEKGK
ncbi:MAG: VanW family protein [Clostridiales bacterium]|jgi:hypothetical protein|nr:VanW family protein [Eubacteriales bacterium]MDH7565175.1 VanW family protein [Clostridiales bacterium]